MWTSSRGTFLDRIITDVFEDFLRKNLPDSVRHLGVMVFEPDHVILEPETIRAVEELRPLHDAYTEAADDLWGPALDTATYTAEAAIQRYPELGNILSSLVALGQFHVAIPITGIPQSVLEFCKLLAVLR